MTKVLIAVGHGIKGSGAFDPGSTDGTWTEQSAGDVIVARAAELLRVAGWAQIDGDHGAGPYDGVHVHLGHVGNARNYVASLVRRDGQAVLSREYGWRGYDDFARIGDGPTFVEGRLYVFQIDWRPDSIAAEVADETGTWQMEGRVGTVALTGPSEGSHVPRIPAGSVGLRLDGLTVSAAVAVRQLEAA